MRVSGPSLAFGTLVASPVVTATLVSGLNQQHGERIMRILNTNLRTYCAMALAAFMAWLAAYGFALVVNAAIMNNYVPRASGTTSNPFVVAPIDVAGTLDAKPF